MKKLIFFALALLSVRGFATPNDVVITQANATTGTSYIQTIVPGQAYASLGTNSQAKASVVGLYVPNIAGLRSAPVTAVPNGLVAYAMGYFTAGDRGSGYFYYNSSSSAADNGGTVIAPTVGTGRWIRTYQTLSLPMFGAGLGGADDSAAIAAAAAWAATGGGSQGALYAPGSYNISSVNLTGLSGLVLYGDGVNLTRFNPIAGANASLFDLSGSSNLTLRNLQIGFYNQTAVPKTAILLGQIGSGMADEIMLEDIYVSGSYSVATLYDYGVPSSHFIHSRFYNYDSATVNAVELTGTNAGAMTSAFITLTSGAKATSDITFVGCEIHDFTANANATAVYLDGTSQISWFGGNISRNSTGTSLVQFPTSNSGITFNGVTFYADNGTAVNQDLILMAGITLTGLEVSNCSTQASGQFLNAAAGATLDTFTYRCKGPAGASGLILMSTPGTLKNSMIYCDGDSISVGAGGSITQSVLFNPGAVTASTDTSVRSTSTGLSVGSSALGSTNQSLTPPPVALGNLTGTININWASGNKFYGTLTGNTTFTFSNAVAGQNIVVRVYQTGTNIFTVTWPTMSWLNNTPPTMTTGKAAHDTTTIDFMNATYDGSSIPSFQP